MGDKYYEFQLINHLGDKITVFYKHENKVEKIHYGITKTVKIKTENIAKLWLEKSGSACFPELVPLSMKCLSDPTCAEDSTYRFKNIGSKSKPTWKFYFKGSGTAMDSKGDLARPSDTVTIGEIPPDAPENEGD